MSIFDKLLETDADLLRKKEGKRMELQRLSDLIGEPFVLEINPLTQEQIDYIGEAKGKQNDDQYLTVLESVRLEGCKLTDKRLLEKFKVHTGVDLLRQLFLPGELQSIYLMIIELTGYGKGALKAAEEEVKKD